MPYTARFIRALVAAALLSALAGPALSADPAAVALTPSGLALARVALESARFVPVSPAGERALIAPGEPLEGGPTFLGEIPVPTGVETSMVTYRPRPGATTHVPAPAPTQSSSVSKSTEVHSVSQLNLGYFVPDGGLGTRFDLGVRGGPVIANALQLGVAADWMYRTETILQPISSRTGPGGVPITQTEQLSRATVNMFPIMAFAQLNLFDLIGLKPYIGGAAGYQVLLLSGEDFTTGRSFDGTFGGWGWQAWAGGSLPLGPRARLTGEAFYNSASTGRDAADPVTGETIHETVDATGKGLRFGVAWGF
jgi:hypothetical protein